MIDERFEDWLATACCAERCKAAQQLCDLVSESAGRPEEMLSRLLQRFAEDPSPKVRMVLARSLADEWRAPPTLVRLLASDIDPIAAIVVRSSPLLAADHLLEIVLGGSSIVRAAAARRSHMTSMLASAIVESGDPLACRALLDNAEASIGSQLLERIADIASHDPLLREQLVRHPGLPAGVRQALVRAVARDLSRSGLVVNLLGERGARLADETCRSATVSIASRVERSELPTFSDRLRRSGEVSTILLAEAALAGELDFFAASLASLSGLADQRVRRMIVDTREAPLRAVLAKAGVPSAAQALLLIAVRHWKNAAQASMDDRATAIVLDAITATFSAVPSGPGHNELVRLLGRMRTRTARLETHGTEQTLKRAA